MSDNDGTVNEESQEQVDAGGEPAQDIDAELAKLDAKLEKFLSQKRWSDVIKTTLAKANLVEDPTRKVELFSEAGNLYLERSSNHAEAIKCFRSVMELEPTNLEAIERLKEMYEKRRDWERLVQVMKAECALLDAEDQPMRRQEIAQLASERLRKPAVCIELWRDVLEHDPDNPEGLAALAHLYERSREWESLVEVLETQSKQITDEEPLAQLLVKMGGVYGDKLKRNEGAVAAYRRLLELRPDDRRAQEQLKKRYVALKAWDDLEEFYAAQGKWDELIRALERAADNKEEEQEQRVALHFRVARLWQERTDKKQRAARAYEKILALDPTSLAAAEALSPIYEEAGDAKKLVDIYAVRLEHTQDDAERVELLRSAAQLYEGKLRDPKAALARYVEAFALTPEDPTLQEDLERSAAAAKDFEPVLAAFRDAIEGATGDAETRLRLSLGRILMQSGQLEEAITHYRQVHESQPDEPEALAALEDLYRRSDRHADLLAVLERRGELTVDDGERRTLAYAMAALRRDELGDVDGAIEAYQAIPLEFGDGETDAYEALQELLEKQERWGDLAQSLENRLDLGPADDETLCALKFRLGNVLLSHLGKPSEAVDMYHEVLTVAPGHEGAIQALERLLAEPETGGRVASLLEPLYEESGEWQKLVRALEVSLDAKEDPAEKIDTLTKIGELHAERLGDPAMAFDVYCRALKLAPSNPGILARLEELGQSQQRIGTLVEQLAELAGSADDPELAKSLYVRAAGLRDEALGDIDGAVKLYRDALALDEGDVEVLGALEDLFHRSDRWSDLVEVLRQRASRVVDPEQQEEVLAQMAFIYDEMLSDPDAAIRIYGEIIEANPASENAMRQLDGLYERREMWPELADNVGRQLSLAEDPGRRTQLMIRLGLLRETRMDATESAIEIYNDVLVTEPAQPEALAALERIVQQPQHQVHVAELLEPLYRDSQQHQKLIGIHEIQVTHSDSADRRVALLQQVAELHEHQLGDLQGAFNSYARALGDEPDNPVTQDNLERIAASADAWEALAQVYEGQIGNVEEPTLRAVLHARAAQIREERVGDREAAETHYREVLKLDETNAEAVEALERIYRDSERYDVLAETLLAKAEMLTSPDDRREHWFQAAAIYDDVLERPEDAVGVYRRVLEADPEDLQALDRLCDLYERSGKSQELLDAYRHKVDIVHDADEKKGLYLRIGQVHEEKLQQPDKAIECYQRVLELDPDEPVAIARLDALYLQSENWEELQSILERQVDLAPTPDEAIAAKHRVGELFEQHLDDPFRAADVYREVLDVAPDHEPTQAALQRMIDSGKEPVAAAQALEPIFRATGDSGRLASTLLVLVEHEEDPLRKVELLHQVAELYEVHLEQPREAFDAYGRALSADHQNEQTLASLERLAERLGAWSELAGLYDVEANRLRQEDPESAMDLSLRLAQIFEVQVGDVDNAIARYRVVLEADPTHQESLQALDRLYSATERWSDLAQVLKREAEVAGDPDDALALQYRLANLQQTSLKDPDSAIAQYGEVLASDPDHEASVTALERLFDTGYRVGTIASTLEPIYRAQGQWTKLVSVSESQLRYESDPAERVTVMHRIAEIAEDRAADSQTAFLWMQRALLEDPSHDHTVEEVERLASTVQGWGSLANTYADLVEGNESPAIQASLGKRLARLYQEELDDVESAEQTFRFILPVASSDDYVLTSLDRIYTEHGAGEALAEVLRMRAAAADVDEDRIEHSYRLGQVLFDQVGAIEDAAVVFSGILDHHDREHEPSIKALENIYTVTGDWQSLYDTYGKERAVALGDSNQADVLGRMAHLASTELNNPTAAVGLLREVLELIGEDPAALNSLGNLYAQQENWSDLVDALEREVAVTTDDSMRVALYQDLGDIWYGKLQRDRSALESWERVLDIDPANTTALTSIAGVHRAAGASSDLVDTLHRVVDMGAGTLPDERLEATYMELGAQYAEQLSQPFDAVEQYRKVLEINPGNLVALDALERLHGSEAQWEEVVGVKRARVEVLDDPKLKVAELLDAAKVWEDKLEQPDGARELYEQVVEIEPEHGFAFERLEALHAAAERHDELIDLYLTRIESTDDVDTRVGLLRKVANVYEHDLDDRGQAFDASLMAWQQDYTNEESADALERVAGLTQRWNEVLTSANAALQEVPEEDVDVRNAICVKCARWYGKEGHPEYAIPFLRQVLAIDPVNRPAVAQMAELHRQTQDWQAYGRQLTKLVEMSEDASERSDVLVQIGELNEEQFGAPEQATKYYTDALAETPNHLGALGALERIYRGREQWVELVDVLQRKAGALVGEEGELAAKLDLAAAYEARTSDKARAVEQYSLVLQEEPDNLQALKGLERVYLEEERWQDLLGVLEKQLDVVSNERDRVDLLLRLSLMWEEEFLKPATAAERLEQVIDIDPMHEEALQGLERLYRQQRRWDDLVRTYERHVEVSSDRGQRAELYSQIGAVQRDEIKDVDQAIDAYLNVVGIEEDSVPALQALAPLYEARGDYSLALDTMDRVAQLVDDPADRVDLLYRMGRLYDTELSNRASAIDHLQRAIDIDPSHLDSLLAMREIHMDEGDHHAAARTLERAAEVETSPRKKAELLVDLGRLYEQKLDAKDRAIEVFAQAYKLDEDSADAALPLVDEYTGSDRWDEAMPLLKGLVGQAQRFAPDERHRLWFTYGECAEKLKDDGVAVKAFGQAFELDSQDLPSLSGLAAAHFRLQSWDEAFKYYQMLLVHHRGDLGTDEITGAFFRLGVIKREQGDRRKALNMFEKALEENGGHGPTLEALVELYRGSGEWQQVIYFKKRLLDATDDVDKRFRLYGEVGDIWKDKLQNPASAIEAYVEASALMPEDHKMLHKLLGLYQVTGQWEALIDVVDRVSELDSRPSVQAKNAYTIGVILRDELKDSSGALERFNQALDLDPMGQLKAFEAVNKLFNGQRDWKGLERAYRKMLHRVTGKGDEGLEFNLWHSLGVIYRDRQQNFDSATEAFSMASRLQPENMQEHRILAELYSRMPERIPDAIAEHHALLQNDPFHVESYRALYALHYSAGQYDRAWCVAAALSFLQKADAEQLQFYQKYRTEGPIRPKSRLTDELWAKALFHEDEDLLVGKLFESVTPAMLQWRKVSDKSLDLRKKDQIQDLNNTTVAFARSFGFVTQVMGLVLTPRLFLRADRPGGLDYCLTIPPASVCGAGLLKDMSPGDVMFAVARHLTYYRGEHYIRTMFQTKDELKRVLAVAMRIAGADIADPTVEQEAAELRARMQPVHLDVLAKIGKRFAEAGARTDIKQWMNAVEYTACRAGFLVCNDLPTAARMIQNLPPMGLLEAGPKERIQDLVLFSVSENYFRLREALGIQIGG